LAVFVLAAATQESFVIGNHVLLALLVAGLTGPWFARGARRVPTSATAPAPR
jgi:hypothetical protein